MTIDSHPAAELFPLLGDDELAELAEDIRRHGLHEPVWVYADPDRGTVLLDGRNRVRACALAGVEVQTRTYTGSDPIGFVISENLKRRHLTVGQKSAIAAEAEPLYAAEAAKRKAQAPGKPRGEKQTSLGADRHQETRAPRSSDRAAKTAGTSGRSVARYKRVAEQAPDLADKVKAGSLALDRAERIIRDREAERRRIEQARREADAQWPIVGFTIRNLRMRGSRLTPVTPDTWLEHLLVIHREHHHECARANEWAVNGRRLLSVKDGHPLHELTLFDVLRFAQDGAA